MNSITRDVYVKRKALNNPISYIRATNAQKLRFRFCDFKIPEEAEARVYVQKPSGKAVYNNASIDGDVVLVEVTTQMFSELGQSCLQLHLVKEEKILVTFAQTVNVLQNYTEGDAAESRNESGFFKEYEDKLGEATNAANSAVEKIKGQLENAESIMKNADKATEAANKAATEAATAAKEAENKANDAAIATENADKATEAANKAATEAAEAKEALLEKADNGEFTGTIKIGTVTTGEPDTTASVENIGTNKDAILNFTIPQGKTGEVKNIDSASIEFTEADKRENLESGDTFKTVFGKIKKFFADIKTVAFTGSYTDLENQPDIPAVVASTNITEAGFVMDGKTASDAFAELNRKLEDIVITRTVQTTVVINPNSSNDPPVFSAPAVSGYKPISVTCTFNGSNRVFLYNLALRADNSILAQFTNTTANNMTISPTFLVTYVRKNT